MNIKRFEDFVENYIPRFVVILVGTPIMLVWISLYWTVTALIAIFLPMGKSKNIHARWDRFTGFDGR